MHDPGTLFRNCLADLDRDRKTIVELGVQFSKVSGLTAACVRDGHPEEAIDLLERQRQTFVTLCELAARAVEQEIALAVKMSELAPQAALDQIGCGVDAFVRDALSYLGRD